MADPSAMVNVANDLFSAGDFEAALKAYEDALASMPDTPELECNRGAALRNLGRPEEALVALDKALELNPEFVQAHHNRGLTLHAVGRAEDAVEAFKAATSRDEGFVQGYIGAAMALNGVGRHEEALAQLDAAVALDMDNVSIHCERAFTLLRMGDPEAALPVCEHATSLAGDSPSTRLVQTHAVTLATIGAAKLQAGQPAEAVEYFGRSIEVEETEGRLLNRAIASVQADDVDAAIVDLQRIIEKDPNHRKAETVLGSLHMNRSEWDDAATHFAAASNIEEDTSGSPELDAGFFYNYGYVLMQQHLYQDAHAHFEYALSLDPDMSAAKSALALVATKLPDEAEGDAEEAAEAEEQSPAPPPGGEEAAGAGVGVDQEDVATPTRRASRRGSAMITPVSDSGSEDEDVMAGMGTVKRLALKMEKKAQKHRRRQSLVPGGVLPS